MPITTASRLTLKELHRMAEHTQADLAAALGIGQDTIARLEQRSDMLLSTLRHYVEGMGGSLELVVRFPNPPPGTRSPPCFDGALATTRP